MRDGFTNTEARRASIETSAPPDKPFNISDSMLMPMTDDDVRSLRLGCRASLAGLILMVTMNVGEVLLLWTVITRGSGETFEIALGAILCVMLLGGAMEARAQQVRLRCHRSALSDRAKWVRSTQLEAVRWSGGTSTPQVHLKLADMDEVRLFFCAPFTPEGFTWAACVTPMPVVAEVSRRGQVILAVRRADA